MSHVASSLDSSAASLYISSLTAPFFISTVIASLMTSASITSAALCAIPCTLTNQFLTFQYLPV